MTGFTRRSLVLGLAAASATGSARAQGATAFRAVAVDVAPLRAQGVGPFATLLADALQAEANRVFAPRLARTGPTLVIRLTGLSLRSYTGSGGGGSGRGGFGGGSDNDYLEGEALVVGPRGEVLARYPQLYAQPASYGGAWYVEGGEARRALALAQNYAAWLGRRVG